MLKKNILIFLTIISFLTYTLAGWSALGKIEEGQVLVWVEHKFSPVHPELTNITHNLDFDGADRDVTKITYIRYDYEIKSPADHTVFTFLGGGPSKDFIKVTFGCLDCNYFSVTQQVYGFYKTNP